MCKFYFTCKQTKKKALVTAHGKRFNVSSTGCHWRELVETTTGQSIKLTDISNTGKHRCRVYRVVEEGILEPTIYPGSQPFDERAFYESECPVCN